jgi:mRNA-degrading endonuclease RelE of RelBE toxin-antitoxin system
VAFQVGHEHHLFRKELSKLPKADIHTILRQVSRWSNQEHPGRNDYESYSNIYPGIARWRVGNYRIYTYHLGGNVYIMLHVYKKLEQSLPKSVKEIFVKRAKFYEAKCKPADLERYAWAF